jgi:putative hydrolase of the HAD superfamily
VKRALLFDLDDTLVPEFATYSAAFAGSCATLLAAHGVSESDLWARVREAAGPLWRGSPVIEYCQQVQIGSVTALFSDFPGEGPELAYLRSWAPTYRRDTLSRALRLVGIDADAQLADIVDAHVRCFASACAPYDDVVPALERLSSSYALAVITNGPSDVQRSKLQISGLERFFSTVVISGELGYAKPDERAFAAALRGIGAGADEVVMVGDHVERDILGARRVAMSAIWVNRSGEAVPRELEPVHQVASLEEVTALLATI